MALDKQAAANVSIAMLCQLQAFILISVSSKIAATDERGLTMRNLNLEVAVDDTRAYTEEQYIALMTEIQPYIVFSLTAGDGQEAFVIKNAPDDYLVWFVGSTTRYVGEDAVIDQFYVTAVSAWYDPHQALDGMCLQMKIDTETLQDEAFEERHRTNVLPGDE